MPGAHEALEHAEHAAPAGHGGDNHGKGNKLGTFIGLTMGLLGVLLALAAAKVGGERTELVESMVEQQSANSRYQSQDVKHRMAFLVLSQVHATMPSAAELAAGAKSPDKKDIIELGQTVQRYLAEAGLAKTWVESYDPAIKAHLAAQEHYEVGQLLAEVGIVLASIALLMQRKAAWFIAIALGVGAVSIIVMTYVHTHKVVHAAEAKIEETGTAYRDARNANKTTAAENALVADVLTWAGGSPLPPPAPAVEPSKHE